MIIFDLRAGPGARMLSLDEIGTTPSCARFSLVQIWRHRRPVAADKLMCSPNRLLLIFTFFIQTPTYYTYLEFFWPEEFNKIVFNMFLFNQDEQDDQECPKIMVLKDFSWYVCH